MDFASRNNNVSAKSKWNKKKTAKTCHQCHQRAMDLLVSCKNGEAEKQKPCTVEVCRKCLLKRYGEKAEEVDLLKDWTCPSCRGICNCCECMKKRGQTLTGVIGRSKVRNPEKLGLEKNVQKKVASNKGKGISFDDNGDGSNSNSTDSTPASNDKKTMEGLEKTGDANKDVDYGLCSSQSSPKSPKVSGQVSEEKNNAKKRVSEFEACLMKDQDFGVLNASKDDDEGGACSSLRSPKRPKVSGKDMKVSANCPITPHIVPRHDGSDGGFLTSKSVNPRTFLLVLSIGLCTLGLGRILG